MLLKLWLILTYALASFGLAMMLYPSYIGRLRRLKVGKTIREAAATWERSEIFAKMHAHKAGTPNVGGGLFVWVVLVMIVASLLLQHFDIINNSLINREETYLLLFSFFSFGAIGLVDDYLNVKWYGTIKWLSAKTKLIGMCVIAGLLAWWFFARLGVDYVSLSPDVQVTLGRFAPVLSFFLTLSIVNAINITDWLDGLAGGLLLIVLGVFSVATFVSGLYIATAVVMIVMAVLAAFLWFNINPAKIFMWDGGAFAIAGLISVLVMLLNMRMGILVPFLIVFLVFWIEIASSALQIFWKKFRKKKLFAIAPFHHLLEHRGRSETTVVMKAWLVQMLLAIVALILFVYQLIG